MVFAHVGYAKQEIVGNQNTIDVMMKNENQTAAVGFGSEIVGEINLAKLLKTMDPTLNRGEYVFCTVKNFNKINIKDVLLFFKEEEGYTLILEKNNADKLKIGYTFIASWITLKVHSSLSAVGLTAAFSKALTYNNISCNVVAGYYHDHIFVDVKDTELAMAALRELSQK